MTHRILAMGIIAAALWFATAICRGQTVTTNGFDWVTLSPTTATTRPTARITFDKFVDPLVTNTPAATYLPSGMAAPEALRRRAAAQGKIESLNASPHSNVGILSGDLKHADRLIAPLHYPEWAMRRWEVLAERIFRTSSAQTPTNAQSETRLEMRPPVPNTKQ